MASGDFQCRRGSNVPEPWFGDPGSAEVWHGPLCGGACYLRVSAFAGAGPAEDAIDQAFNFSSMATSHKVESLQPLVHRLPLPEVLYKVMISVASMWNWRRWCATLVMVYEGIGQAMRALRRDLVLPSDNFVSDHMVAYMKVSQPKTRRRGRGKVQHLRIENEAAVLYLEKVFSCIHFQLLLSGPDGTRSWMHWASHEQTGLHLLQYVVVALSWPIAGGKP